MTNKREKISLYIMAAFYVIAGVNHFMTPEFYKKIMPPLLPWHLSLIHISGIFEIALGLLLLAKQTRRMAAWGIIALLVAVFPANVQMMLNYQREQNSYLWMAVLRLPLQIVLILWAYQFTRNRRNKG